MKVNPIISFVFCFIFSFSIGQDLPAEHLTRDSLMAVSRVIIKNAGNCALISIDETGIPRARTMDPFPPDENLIVWLGTNSRSRKVTQIRNDPRVTLYYFDKGSSSYVTIYGKAILVEDPKILESKWKDEWKEFYAEGKENYMLIKVIPEKLELLAPVFGVFNDPVTWQPLIITF